MKKFDLYSIQKAIANYKLDGWLFYDFQGSDQISRSILEVSTDPLQHNRWFYYIPAKGIPVKILHSFDLNLLDHLPGRKEIYFGWKEIEEYLKKCFQPKQIVAVQYSPKNAVPYISRIDAGTFELLKSFKIKLVSSADLVQLFEARLTTAQVNTHINAARLIYSVSQKAIGFINKQIKEHQEINECIVQEYISKQLLKNGLIFSRKPQIAAGQNTNNPHYMPSEKKMYPLYPGQLLQFQIGAKMKEENSVYADISWVYFLGESVPDKIQQVFAILVEARDTAVENIDHCIQKKKVLRGWKVDDDIAKFITEAGYGRYILHKSGHSIGSELYGNGANIDNFETKENRALVHGTCFTLEPGIYFTDYGMRSGINVYIDEQGAHVHTQPVQQEIIPILT